MYHWGMRQMEERHVANQVDVMVWSNKLDLFALSNMKGEVQVHRLQWQKVWNLPPPAENVTVRMMAWRPDGKELAIGYSSGKVYIVDIEDKEILNQYDLELQNSEEFEDRKHFGVTCITWAAAAGTLESATEYNLYTDPNVFLQKPTLNANNYKNRNNDDNVKNFKEIQDQTQLNMLVVGYGPGNIFMSIFGRYPYGTVSLSDFVQNEFGEYEILDIILSDDFSIMNVFYLDKTLNSLFVALIDTSILSSYAEETFIIANKHSQVVQLLSYLDQTMVSITEAWEHILLEMDTKMAYYAASVSEGGVSADLLELLMFGVPSDELELFLLQDLTTKGLKKFGSSVELSYSTIQKLVLKQLNIVGQSLAYYFSELRGLARVTDRYKILGLEESTVTEAIKACFAFLNKCLELQQVIDVSMRNYKAFFRWLFVVIVRLLDEQTPSEIVKITQQELSHIAEFLYNFDNVQVENSDISGEKPVKFNLERLGQYLQDQDLSILPDDEDNPWQKFLNENPCFLKDNDTIFTLADFKKFSLVQQHKYLKEKINGVFNKTDKDISNNLSVLHNIRCYDNVIKCSKNLKVSQIFDAKSQTIVMAFLDVSQGHDGVCFMTYTKDQIYKAGAMKYYFTSYLLPDFRHTSCSENLEVLDLQFYSTDFLSVLTKHPHIENSTIFIQFPIKTALENAEDFNIKSNSCLFGKNICKRNISELLDQGVYKVLDKMDAFRISVSGGRKVSVILSKSKRRVRVYEMEADADDEDEDTLDTTPSFSMHDSHNTSQIKNDTI